MSLTASKAEISADVSQPKIWEQYATPIEYGICQTDRKPHELHFRQMNHVFDHHDIVRTHLSEIGLPYDPRDFLVGTRYDLLFLKNHGIVIKVGKDHDPVDLIHPCFSQPLWWATDTSSGITTSVYAGEKLTPETLEFGRSDAVGFIEVVMASGQKSGDVQEKSNMGFAKNLPILIDVDAFYNATFASEKKALKKKLGDQWLNDPAVNNADGMRDVLFEVYGEDENLKPWMEQFDRHQPLRRMFWDAQALPENENEKVEGLKRLWSTVADCTADLPSENNQGWLGKLKSTATSLIRPNRPDRNTVQLHRDYLIPPAA